MVFARRSSRCGWCWLECWIGILSISDPLPSPAIVQSFPNIKGLQSTNWVLHLRYVESINLKTWEGLEGLCGQTHIIHQADKNQKGEPQIQLAEKALLDLSPLLLVAEASVKGVEARGPGVLFNAWICLNIAQQSICRCSRRHRQLAESKNGPMRAQKVRQE